jgi:menaquinone-dependent protoporphyrinogen oxidase
VLQYIQPVYIAVKPVSVGLFAGCMDYGKLSAIMRLQVQTKGLPEGDFRDWDAIRTWAARLPSLLANGEQL